MEASIFDSAILLLIATPKMWKGIYTRLVPHTAEEKRETGWMTSSAKNNRIVYVSGIT